MNGQPNKNIGMYMDQNSQHDTTASPANSLENQLREIYGRVAYTHKTHEKMADIYIRNYNRIKCVKIALSAITASSLLLAIYGDSKCGTVIGAILSTILLAITLYFKEANLGEQSQKHTAAASKLWGIRERLLSLLIDLKDGKALEAVRLDRDQINNELEGIYKIAPRTSITAYTAAQKALKKDEELYFSDNELDHLLPTKLRSSKQE